MKEVDIWIDRAISLPIVKNKNQKKNPLVRKNAHSRIRMNTTSP